MPSEQRDYANGKAKLACRQRGNQFKFAGHPGNVNQSRHVDSAGPANTRNKQGHTSCSWHDDWAKRKGQSYGTILVDLEKHEVVDLLPERSAESVSKSVDSNIRDDGESGYFLKAIEPQ